MRISSAAPTHQSAEPFSPTANAPQSPFARESRAQSDMLHRAEGSGSQPPVNRVQIDARTVEELCAPGPDALAQSVATHAAIRRGIARAIEAHEPDSPAAAHHRTVAAAMSPYTTPAALLKFTRPDSDIFAISPRNGGSTMHASLNTYIEEHAIEFVRDNLTMLRQLPDDAAIGRAFVFNKERALQKYLDSQDQQALAAAIPPFTFVMIPKLLIAEQLRINRIKADRLFGTECLVQKQSQPAANTSAEQLSPRQRITDPVLAKKLD